MLHKDALFGAAMMICVPVILTSNTHQLENGSTNSVPKPGGHCRWLTIIMMSWWNQQKISMPFLPIRQITAATTMRILTIIYMVLQVSAICYLTQERRHHDVIAIACCFFFFVRRMLYISLVAGHQLSPSTRLSCFPPPQA